MRKKKVRLKANNRKSISNAFSNALDDTEVAKSSKLQKKQTNYSDSHNNSNLRKKLQEDEEDNNLSPTVNILKSKPSISRRRRHGSTEDQNPFQDILTEDDVLNNSTTRKSIARSTQKESSKRSMHRNVDMSKDRNDNRRKSMRTSQAMLLESIGSESLNSLTPNVEIAMSESNTKEIVQSSDESINIIHNKLLKLKSRFIQRTRKSIGRNAFADVLADDGADSHFSTSDLNKENDVHKSLSQSSPSKRSANRSKTNIDITPENSPIRRSTRSSLNAVKKRSLDVQTEVQAEDNIEVNSSSSSLDDNVYRRKKSVFLKPKSSILEKLRKSITKNPYEEILEEDNIQEDNSLIHRSLTIEKSSQSKKNKTTSEEDYDVSLRRSPNVERDVSSENENELSENRDFTNASKSISRKNVIAKTPEKEFSSNRKSAREETLKEHTRINAMIGSTNTNEIVTHEIINDDNSDADDLRLERNKFKQVSSPSKEARLTRSLRNQSEIPISVNIGVHEVTSDSHNDADREHDSNISKRVSKSSPAKEIRLTRNSLRNRSETPKLAHRGIHEAINNSYNDANREHDSSIFKQSSKSSPAKEAPLTHKHSSRNRSETPKPASKDVSKRSINWIADIEEDDNVNTDSEINIGGVSQIISSTRISKVSVSNVGAHKSTIISAEMEMADDGDVNPRMQTIQRNVTSTRIEIGNKTANHPSVQSSNRTSVPKEGRETASRQKSLGKSQNSRNTPIKASSKDISFNASKLNSSKTSRKIDDFFKVKQASITTDKRSNERAQKSQIFDTENMEKIKTELERIKNREMAAMKIRVTDKKESALKAKNVKSITLNPFKQATKKKPFAKSTKVVDKAFLVDGKLYRAPRLSRPKQWVTDRLYKFLWNRMESKYKLRTRLKSEKFIQELAKIVSTIERRKDYKTYKTEMELLMREMARLKIINTRNDFYYFCQDFLPYEFRVKVVPMLLPGNKMNIPYNPEKLHTPLLDIID